MSLDQRDMLEYLKLQQKTVLEQADAKMKAKKEQWIITVHLSFCQRQ
jgi:hypothetical protein